MEEYRKGDSVDYLIGGWTPATPNATVMFCCKCLSKVYVAPSGRRIMKENPGCKPLCLDCMLKTDGEFSVKRPSNADIVSDLNGHN